MGVDHGRFHVLMNEEFLDGTDIIAVLKQVSCERVAEAVGCGPFGDASLQVGRSLAGLSLWPELWASTLAFWPTPIRWTDPDQYLAVQEEQRAEGLILCRSSHVVLTCQGGEKLADSLLQPMSLVVVEDKALGPIDAGFLRAEGTVLEPYCIAYLVEQSSGSPRYASLRQSGFAYRARL